MGGTPTNTSKPTAWKIATSTKDSWQMLLDACINAKKSIYFEQFLFEPDDIGKQFIEIFIQKAREGVTVKLILDSAYSWGLGQSSYVNKMLEAGVKLKFFNWLFPFSKHNKKLFYFRNHRRLIIIDRETMYTGGVCINKRMENWRETHMRIEGPVVDQALAVFDQTWKRVYRKRTLQLGVQYKSGIGGFSYITQSPLPAGHHLYNRLIDAVRNAKREIYLTTPYFLPDSRLQRVLILAKKRGVDVRILLPKDSNTVLADLGSHTYYHRLLSKGIRIFQYENMIHAKTGIIDNDWAMLGTLNLDNISLKYNFESAIISTEPLFVDELREIFLNDLKNCREVTLEEWNNRSLWQQLLELCVWPIRKFL